VQRLRVVIHPAILLVERQTMTDITTTTILSNTGTKKSRAPRSPSRTALATRSATEAMRLTGDAQREALRQHFTQFASAIGNPQTCHR
jgi:hypothetical protein